MYTLNITSIARTTKATTTNTDKNYTRIALLLSVELDLILPVLIQLILAEYIELIYNVLIILTLYIIPILS